MNEKKRELTVDRVVDLLDYGNCVKSMTEKTVSEKYEKEKEEDGICVVCFSNPINSINLPCGHSATCMECAKTEFKRTKKCVMCRGDVTRYNKMFKPN